MALLDAKEFQFGRQNVWAATVGAADIPTTNTSGVIQLGDLILNLSGAIGAPAFWVCTTAGTSPVFTSGPTVGGGSTVRSVAAATTLLSSDRYLFVTAAATVTLPAPSAALGTHSYAIKATGQPVTITAASGSFDGVATGSQTLTSQETAEVFTDGTNWFTVGRDDFQQVRTVAAPVTASVNDRYLLTAGAVTLPAPAGWAIGKEVIIHVSGTSTVTPASGTINAAAALTLSANTNARIITDGTNFFTVN